MAESIYQNQGLTLTGTGLLLSFLGILAVIFPFFTGISISILFGILLILSGFSTISTVSTESRGTGAIGLFILSIIYLIAGLTMITNPILGLATLTLIIIAYLAITGISEIFLGLAVEDYRSIWTILSGIFSSILSYLIFIGWPSTAATSIGILFGLSLISTGISLIVLQRTKQQKL